MTADVGLFYASTTGNTERIAETILQLSHLNICLHDVALEGVNAMPSYRHLIVGISTWDFGELQEDWQACVEELKALDLNGVRVAMFGLGDQLGYGEWFVDAMGIVAQQLEQQGATLVCAWPRDGYDFEASRALTSDGKHFVGLALDEDTQSYMTDERLAQWLEQVDRDLVSSH